MNAQKLVLNQIETNNGLEETMLNILESNISDYETVEEIKYYMENEAICQNGSVGGLIYYSETNEIFKNYFSEILEMLEYGKQETGEMPNFELNANNLVWWAFEYLVYNWTNSIDWSDLEEDEEEIEE